MVNDVVTNAFPQKNGTIMKYVGADLHKQTITVCVVDLSRSILERRRLVRAIEPEIVRFFETRGRFEPYSKRPPVADGLYD